jgi:hypothetical protein
MAVPVKPPADAFEMLADFSIIDDGSAVRVVSRIRPTLHQSVQSGVDRQLTKCRRRTRALPQVEHAKVRRRFCRFPFAFSDR